MSCFSRRNSGVNDEIVTVMLHTCRIPNRHCGLHDHDRIRITLNNQFLHCIHSRSVKEVLFTIAVHRSTHNNKISRRIRCRSVQCGGPVKRFFCQIFFYILILIKGIFLFIFSAFSGMISIAVA